MSVSVRAGLQMLLQLVERHEQRIRRGAHLTRLVFNPPVGDSFTIQAFWADGETFTKELRHEDYFTWSSGSPKLKSSPCRISSQLIREILQARGL